MLLLFCFVLFGESYTMGFSPMLGATPFAKDRQVSNQFWSVHANAMIIHLDMPWTVLLRNKTNPVVAVKELLAPAVEEMNAFGVKDLFVTLDVTDHLDRSSEAPELIAMNRSITEPEVQKVYASFAHAVSLLLKPNALGLAAETNFIRKAAKADVWEAVGE